MTKPIRLLELFSGIQSQERALRQLNIPYESVGTCDCDKDVLVSAAAMRFDLQSEIKNYTFPSVDVMVKELQDKNIGYDFDNTKHTITSRTPITKLKRYYISDKLLKNLGDISKVDRLPRANIVTYSSPCQSFSVAGKLAGAAKTCTKCGHKWDIDFSNPDYNYTCPICRSASLESTTSGLLQEVQRLLSIAYEENELPEYLLLENVKNLAGTKFIGQFKAWIKWLDSIGYNTRWKILNAKYYGVPQNRERLFAISIRKDIDDKTFEFPDQISLTTRLRDILEKEVDAKYYLPDERMEEIIKKWDTKQTSTTDDSPEIQKLFDIPKEVINDNERQRRVYSVDGISPTLLNRSDSPKIQDINEPFVVASRGRYTDDSSTEQKLEPNFTGCTNTLTSVQKDNYVCEPLVADDTYKGRTPRAYANTSPTLRSERFGFKVAMQDEIQWRIRKLTAKECFRLMGFTDKDYDRAAQFVSESQLYKQAGNSIVTSCLIAIFHSLFIKNKDDGYQKYLIDFNG